MKAKSHDLTWLLDAWVYDEHKTTRKIKGRNGREILQVRLPLGVEQYEIDGRPDGKRPMDHESWLHYYWYQAKSVQGRAEEHVLTKEDFSRLQEEGLLYYYRYLLFFQLQEYRLCARDTRRNLKLLDFVSRYFPKNQAEQLEQYRPYILRMNFMAKALFKAQEHSDLKGALRLLRKGVKAIEELRTIQSNQIFAFEKVRSLKSLEDLISQLESHLPVPAHVQLVRQMKAAIQEENYEKAAALRDQIALLKREGKAEKK
jgi:hypothetical protein